MLASFLPKTALLLSQIWEEGVGDFAAREQALLAALKHDGARFLENLLNDPDLPVKDKPTAGPRAALRFAAQVGALSPGLDNPPAPLPL